MCWIIHFKKTFFYNFLTNHSSGSFLDVDLQESNKSRYVARSFP